MFRVFRNVLFLCSIAFACTCIPAAGDDRPAGKRFALLVGVNTYHHADLPNLKYTENDVEELNSLLVGQGGFDKVLLLTTTRGKKRKSAKPTVANLKKQLKAILKNVTKHDTVLVALSGHGVQLEVKGNAEGFFCPSDAKPKDPTTMVGLTQLFEDLKDSGAGVKLLLVDACRNEIGSKGAKALDTDAIPRPPKGFAALLSCSAGQKSYETDKLGKGHGVFFYHVLKGLKGDAKNKAKEVTWDRLATYVKEEVPDAVTSIIGDGAQQSPHLVSNLTGKPAVLVRLDGNPAGSLAKEVVNSVKMKFKLIPAGSFTMGSPNDEEGRGEDEGPVHKVKITRPFYLSAFLVTQAQYKAVMGENPSHFAAKGPGSDEVRGHDTDEFPVESVSWHEAKKFCDKLTALPDERKAGRAYRLPTEAQWEYACRAGTSTPFNFGKSASSKEANFDGNYPYGGGEKGKFLERPTKVNSYEANRWGLHDMHGNVYQWTADWYEINYYASSPEVDTQGPKTGTARVMRGGCFRIEGRFCRAAFRGYDDPDHRRDNIGFRVLLVAPPAKR
jgi:formylglycine-generating enzyme required for sulfatase activity